MTTQGCCKYCGEFRMVEVAEGATAEHIDRKATEQCGCETARMLRFFSQAGMYEDEEQEFCLDIIRALRTIGSIASLSFKFGGDTFTITPMATGEMKVKRRRTETEERKF